MTKADVIRLHGKEKYVAPARRRQEKRFSIRTGDVLRDLRLNGRAPAICSALKTREFLEENALRLISRTGPPSGQSTTVTYTYEFVTNEEKGKKDKEWIVKMRGTGSAVRSRTSLPNWVEARTTFAMNALISMVREKTGEPHLLGHDALHLLAGDKSPVWGKAWMRSGYECKSE